MPTTPFGYRLATELDNEFLRMANEWFFPWHGLNSGRPVNVDGFDGRRISYEGIGFTGSPEIVFWKTLRRYVGNKLDSIFNAAEAEIRLVGHDRAAAIAEDTAHELRFYFARLLKHAIEVDRALKGKGFPDPNYTSPLSQGIGYSAAIEHRRDALTRFYMVKFSQHFPTNDFDIVAPDGIVRARTKGIYATDTVMIEDTSVHIEAGDELRRTLSNGREEVFTVVDPVFNEQFHTIPAHYQVVIQRKGAFPAKTGGNYSFHLTGPNARVNLQSTDNSTNIAVGGDLFGNLSAALRAKVGDEDKLQQLLSAVEEMKRTQSQSGFAAAYQKFVALSADHLSIIAPFLPALAGLIHS
jgi:hypothetical protein